MYIRTSLLILLSLLSCTPTAPKIDQRTLTHRSQPKIIASNVERQIHDLINKERRNHGLTPLAWDDALSGIAKMHSMDMAKRNYFSHDSPEGHDLSYRYKERGYSCALRVNEVIYKGAENIFQNNLYDSITTVNGENFYDWNSSKKISETTVQGWMRSAGHRKNILTPYWRREGIGVIVAPDDKVYITQNFC